MGWLSSKSSFNWVWFNFLISHVLFDGSSLGTGFSVHTEVFNFSARAMMILFSWFSRGEDLAPVVFWLFATKLHFLLCSVSSSESFGLEMIWVSLVSPESTLLLFWIVGSLLVAVSELMGCLFCLSGGSCPGLSGWAFSGVGGEFWALACSVGAAFFKFVSKVWLILSWVCFYWSIPVILLSGGCLVW